jgi:phage baseplate assembly protein W
VPLLDENKNKKPFLNDRDDDVSVGLKLPIILDNGQEASTKTTIDAVKQNLKNFLNTEQGERVMQPTLGVQLKRYLFEPFSEDVVVGVQNTIRDALGYWMPFVKVNNIVVQMSANQTADFQSVMEVLVEFSLKKDPSTSESVQVTIGD